MSAELSKHVFLLHFKINFCLISGKKSCVSQFLLTVLFVVLRNSLPLWLNGSRYGERADLNSGFDFHTAYFCLAGGKT